MLTLQRIRKTQQENERLKQSQKNNYKSPSGFSMLSRFMKEKNLEILNDFCDREKKSSLDRELIIKKYHKLNYYIPSVSYVIKNEEDQFNETDDSMDSDHDSTSVTDNHNL